MADSVRGKYERDEAGWAAFLLSPRVARVSQAAAADIRDEAVRIMTAAGSNKTGKTAKSFTITPTVTSTAQNPAPRWGAKLGNTDPGMAELETGHSPRTAQTPLRPMRRAGARWHTPITPGRSER